MKAVLVIDIPDDYYNEHWRNIDDFGVDYQLNMYVDFQPPIKVCERKGVLLRPLPQKKSIELACQKEDEGNDYGAGLIVGWNDCLREITGETE